VQSATTNSLLIVAGTKDGMRNFVAENRRQPTEPYATEDSKKAWLARMERDGFEGPQAWYKAMARGFQYEAEKSIPPELAKVNVPVLFFGGERDFVCRPQFMAGPVGAGLLPDLQTATVRLDGQYGTCS
jgi:soluble epoxide hydrolase / lipid-phosphate phosphatase